MDQTPRYLFVNKNDSSNTLTQSTSEEKSDILRHVQSRRRDRQREDVPARSWSSYTYTFRAGAQDKTDLHPAKPLSASGEKVPSETPSRIAKPPDRVLQVYPVNNGLDPFHCTVLGSDANVQVILSSEILRIARMTFLAEAFAPVTVAKRRPWMRHDSMILRRMQHCIHDDMLMYSTLGFVASYLSWNFGKTDALKPPENYIDKALQAARTRVADTGHNVDMWLLLAIEALAITALWNGCPELWVNCPSRIGLADPACLKACRTHLLAMCSLVKTSGGWQNIEPYVLESTLLADKYLAVCTMEPPIIPLDWDPGPWIQDLPANGDVSHQTMPRLGINILREPMCRELAQITSDIVDYVQIAHYAWADSDRTLNVERWLFLRLQAFAYRLLQLDNLQGLDDCIRIATLIFLHTAIEDRGALIGANILLPHLRSALISMRHWESEIGQNLLLWCVCMGGMTTAPTAAREWFINVATDVSFSVGLAPDVDLLAEELEKYLFTEAQQRCLLVSLVEGMCAQKRPL